MLRALLSSIGRLLAAGRNTQGNVAIVFAISVMPVLMATGAAVDFSRMSTSKSQLQNATDTVALTIAKDIERGKTQSQIQADINSVFGAEMKTAGLSNWSVNYSYDSTTGVVTANSSASLASVMLNIINVRTLTVGAQSKATFGTDYVELALVLDNTGSMNSSNKLASLKTAANSMIDKIAASQAGKDGRASVAVIPFGVTVNVGTAYDSATWLSPKASYQSCRWDWFLWRNVCTTVYYTWTGCVNDRASPYTNTGTAPTTTIANTLYPREYDVNYCTTATITPLTTDYTAAKLKITGLVANGNTNIPIGAMWGWNMLTPGAPASNAGTATVTKKISRYAIILTDGLNTENGLGQTVAQIDTNTTDTCTAMKTAGITVFTIRVIDGNETLLRNCASSSDYYYDVSDPSALTGVFSRILTQITKLRLTS